jgi:hypothetical protein
MRTRIVQAGVLALVLAIVVEVVGVLYGSGFLQHNLYGFAGGILAVLGTMAVSAGRAA